MQQFEPIRTTLFDQKSEGYEKFSVKIPRAGVEIKRRRSSRLKLRKTDCAPYCGSVTPCYGSIIPDCRSYTPNGGSLIPYCIRVIPCGGRIGCGRSNSVGRNTSHLDVEHLGVDGWDVEY